MRFPPSWQLPSIRRRPEPYKIVCIRRPFLPIRSGGQLDRQHNRTRESELTCVGAGVDIAAAWDVVAGTEAGVEEEEVPDATQT